jgi:hypothetical protein
MEHDYRRVIDFWFRDIVVRCARAAAALDRPTARRDGQGR